MDDIVGALVCLDVFMRFYGKSTSAVYPLCGEVYRRISDQCQREEHTQPTTATAETNARLFSLSSVGALADHVPLSMLPTDVPLLLTVLRNHCAPEGTSTTPALQMPAPPSSLPDQAILSSSSSPQPPQPSSSASPPPSPPLPPSESPPPPMTTPTSPLFSSFFSTECSRFLSLFSYVLSASDNVRSPYPWLKLAHAYLHHDQHEAPHFGSNGDPSALHPHVKALMCLAHAELCSLSVSSFEPSRQSSPSVASPPSSSPSPSPSSSPVPWPAASWTFRGAFLDRQLQDCYDQIEQSVIDSFLSTAAEITPPSTPVPASLRALARLVKPHATEDVPPQHHEKKQQHPQPITIPSHLPLSFEFSLAHIHAFESRWFHRPKVCELLYVQRRNMGRNRGASDTEGGTDGPEGQDRGFNATLL
eukprot:TRINITY_DN6265_c0_g3_i1.p1 TRINITY_DN6265_c0_g3~~TRINITY_DN6265_c0_g3_i1.p1  ORF type:complete len:418 (-),score=69.53 TRINITY_DN6265_c0_g3_i1:29-1282(-)